MKPFKLEHTPDRQANTAQLNAQQATRTVLRGPFGDGNLVKDVVFTANTVKEVNHGLGRKPQGWFAGHVRALNTTNLIEYASTTSASSDERRVLMEANVDCTVDIWFY